jgi:hypothetical protein
MPDVPTNDIPREQKKLLLESMHNGPAFLLFCEEWDKHVAIIQDKINDPATSNEETRELKLVREQLVKTRHPRKVLETLIRKILAQP